ncbi:putative DMT superfamily transporter inner membrane protein [Streptococcus pneumoniae]|jgi:drug/metabolite transporter (DMT)-like permease|uniref:DMT family transporter n=1 Tax=Stutzerimonas stutzeri TaxID=316 RepID=UPI0005DB67B6|nr:DMT family transporter [Stutzerimonas stutzeri]MBW8455549.1 DMT family transporter [Pseudomonas sp.]CJL00923.1 putative DMT superfamily transporter inner membrane protein [Streptococcus pneumoniae]MCQ4227849.1 DMT family transporter [Stutzerimonas stutzeri]OWG35947.1 EamA family transporter [Stutzerimonas stutzeri]RRV45979.1 DMT family transporter [Stutzerimonas stutzeri]
MSARQGPAFAGLLIAVLCWSGNALVGRAFHDSIPPLSLSFWRWVLATSLLLPFVAKGIWTHRATLRAAGWRLPVLAAMGIASYNSLLYTAAQSTEAINLTLVNTCLPLATFIGAGFLLGEWPLRRAWFGMAVAAGGLLYLISRGSWQTFASLSFQRGDLIMLLAVLAWALYTLLLRRWARHLLVPPLVLLGVLMLLGLPLILPFYLLELGRVGGFALTPSNLAAISYTAVFASLVAYVGWNHGVKIVGAGRAAMVMYLMPVFTALLGWVLLGEALRTFHWIGGALIFAGLLLATRPSFR